jgi:glycerol-3-phosphate acyltransferase PlsY
MPWAWLLIPATYLLASISFAYWAGRLCGIDLRSHGSGNLGATNAGRVLGLKWFLVVFALDTLKSLVPIMVAWQLHRHGASVWLPLSTAIVALLGHSFTCFHRFKGGKGVATSLGLLIGMTPWVAVISLSTWSITWLIGRFIARMGNAAAVAPASIVAAITVPSALFATDRQALAWQHLPLTCFYCFICVLVLIRHRSNIRQLVGLSPAASATPVAAGGAQGPSEGSVNAH